MTETYLNVNSSVISNMCRVCFTTAGVRPMSVDELKWYQSVVYKDLQPVTTMSDCKMSVCEFCGHIISKYLLFTSRCQDAHYLLSTALQQGSKFNFTKLQSTLVHNFTITAPLVYYLGPEDLDVGTPLKTEEACEPELDVPTETEEECEPLHLDMSMKEEVYDDPLNNTSIDDDDDTPLVMLRSDGDKPRKKKKKNGQPPPAEGQYRSERSKRSGRSEQPRAGFSSRMVQETDEYTVIKLTKDQVVAELRSRRASSPRYVRAPHRCERCVKGFNFEDVLAKHMLSHDPASGPFKCDICAQYCRSAVSLRGHMKSHTTRYKCKICGAVRLSRQHLLEHHGLAHTGQPVLYRCTECDHTTYKRTVMQRHVRGHRAAARLPCERCPRVFRTREALRVHVARHDGSRRAACPQCGRRFLYASQLHKHVQSVHDRTDYYCVECDHRFKSPENLRLHFKKSKRHRDPATTTEPSSEGRSAAAFPCGLCGKVFTRKSVLTAHARTHAAPHT